MTNHSAYQDSRPNIVIVFTDDQGYGDVGCFGSTDIRTPHLDQMASEGTKFTSFNVGASICTPSRAALMTGCYPRRVGLEAGVLFPNDEEGLNPNETTIATMLSDCGYASACIGKWHLGDREPVLPTNHGFDSYFGIPYSNDMGPDHGATYPPLPLMRDEKIVEKDPDQRQLTRRYTDAAIEFIESQADREQPFFLYLPHTMPHVPLYASDQFTDTSARGLYGDVIEEIDWSVGRILHTIGECGVAEETLVLFTSDNGPWLGKDEHGGDAGPLRGGKASIWEGGVRMPAIARWPDEIPPGTTCTELVTAMDLLPTVAALCGGDLPADRVIDGENIAHLLRTPEEGDSPHEYYFYHTSQGTLGAIRDADGWKYHLDGDHLYDLRRDIGERRDISALHPDTAERLRAAGEAFDSDIEAERRSVGRID